MFEVSAIITTHAEGELIRASVESCLAAKKVFEEKFDLSIEVILVMDRPSSATRKVVGSYSSGNVVFELDYGDQGMVRNEVVKRANGRYIAFLDGDDLWSENWLVEAYKVAEENIGKCVVYPEFNWYFEDSSNILCQIDGQVSSFDYEALRAVNLWDALCFCPKQIYLDYPFTKRRIVEGFAYEDWHWNRQLFEANIVQKNAIDTIIFKRRRGGSQGSEASKRGVMALPTESCYYDFYDNAES